MNAKKSVLCLIACLLGSQAETQDAPAEKPPSQPSTEDRFEVRYLEGWTVYINRDVPRQYPEQTAKTLEHLGWELYQIKLAAPALAVRDMQENNAIWIEYQEKVDLSYHPERSWLIGRGYTIPRDPQSFMSLSVKTHVGDSYRHPFVVFHELAHGYDYHFIAEAGRKQLHEVPIWLEIGQVEPYIRYCGSSGPLTGERVNPDKFGAVEIRDPQSMLKWVLLQQSDVLHELALAYYDRHAARRPIQIGAAIRRPARAASRLGQREAVLCRVDGELFSG